jgi:hypothetical protein
MRPHRRLAIVASALLIAGCGGGLWIGIDGSDCCNSRPSVSLATAQTSVQAGQSLRVVAAASDRDGIDSVAFYRYDSGVWLRLGSDGSSPYEWDVAVPADGRTTVEVFARARDGWGYEADSNVVSVSVTP